MVKTREPNWVVLLQCPECNATDSGKEDGFNDTFVPKEQDGEEYLECSNCNTKITMMNAPDFKHTVCVICKKVINGYGNNPYPVKEEGECCDTCNLTKVIPARIKRMGESEKQKS